MYFFVHFLNIGGDGCYGAWQQLMLMFKRYLLFLVVYNGNALVSEKRKKQRKKIQKSGKNYEYIFFS